MKNQQWKNIISLLISAQMSLLICGYVYDNFEFMKRNSKKYFIRKILNNYSLHIYLLYILL